MSAPRLYIYRVNREWIQMNSGFLQNVMRFLVMFAEYTGRFVIVIPNCVVSVNKNSMSVQ